MAARIGGHDCNSPMNRGSKNTGARGGYTNKYDDIIRSALGERPFDLAVVNGRVVNVCTGGICESTIGITDGVVACVPDAGDKVEAGEVIDAGGGFVVPGLVDSHMHIESSMATPASFAEAVLPHGTTTVAADPHEIANVLGVAGVRLLIEASRGLPLKILFMVPSTVPSAPGFETGGADFGLDEVESLIDDEGVIGLAEVMDFWGVVNRDGKISGIVDAMRAEGRYIEGHCPVFSGRRLQAYIAAGIDADHTIMTVARAKERLRAGMTVQIQDRFITPDLMAFVNSLPDASDVLIVTDDVSALRLCSEGHLDASVRKAIRAGLDPVRALQSVTIKAARRLRLYDRGLIAPGRAADLLVLDSLADFKVDLVLVDGKIVAGGGHMRRSLNPPPVPDFGRGTVRLEPVMPGEFRIKADLDSGSVEARVVSIGTTGSYTTLKRETITVSAGCLEPGDGICTIAVLHRHGRVKDRAVRPCLIEGFGTVRGAMATTFAHDCHNLVVVGSSVDDMAKACNALIACGGGLAAVRDGEVLALVELPIAGILSDRPIEEIAGRLKAFTDALRGMGVAHDDPLSALTLLSLAVSPEAKVTDLGLVDVVNRRFLDLIAAEGGAS